MHRLLDISPLYSLPCAMVNSLPLLFPNGNVSQTRADDLSLPSFGPYLSICPLVRYQYYRKGRSHLTIVSVWAPLLIEDTDDDLPWGHEKI